MRTRKAAQLRNTLEAANNSVKLLNEMLAHFNLEESTDEDKELIKVCFLQKVSNQPKVRLFLHCCLIYCCVKQQQQELPPDKLTLHLKVHNAPEHPQSDAAGFFVFLSEPAL